MSFALQPPHPSPPSLTSEQRALWDRDGFLVVDGFVAPSACDALMARAAELVDAFEPAPLSSIFSSTDQARTTDGYFLGSGDKVRFFFEEGAFDARGALRGPKALMLNKIGHAMHDLDPVFSSFSRTPALAALTRSLGIERPLLLQSMYIFKQPHIGGEVVCHQDATYLYTEPLRVIGFWFALQDATLANGCLWALPGGHRQGLKSRFVREAGEGGDGVRTVVLDPTPFPPVSRENGYVPLEVKKGALIVLHGLCPHLSAANTSDASRHAYTLHVIDEGARYPEDNWLRRDPAMPARGFA